MVEIPREEKLPDFCTDDNLIKGCTEDDLRALAEISPNATCKRRGKHLYFKSGDVGRTWKIFVTEGGKLYLAKKEKEDDKDVLEKKIKKVRTRDVLVGQFREILNKHLIEKGGIESASVILDSGEEKRLEF